MPGRPRKPTALKVLQGNAGRRPLPENEPTPPAGAGMPSTLPDRAKPYWAELAAVLESMKVLTVADARALAILCVLLSDFDAQAAAGSADPRLASEIRGYFGRFGMTPADRSRVAAAAPEDKSKLSRFLGGTKKA
jgi:hypothetical protein